MGNRSTSNNAQSIPSSALNNLWWLIEELKNSIKRVEFKRDFSTPMTSTLKELYSSLKTLEESLRSDAKTMQWNNHQRVQWLEEVNDTKRYSVRHLVCCVFTLEKELRQNAQLESWVLNGRSDWLDACERLEAKKLEFRSSRLTLQEIALQGVSQSHQIKDSSLRCIKTRSARKERTSSK